MGATLPASRSPAGCCCFNPRARDGRDLRLQHGVKTTTDSFNPRARDGRDRVNLTY